MQYNTWNISFPYLQNDIEDGIETTRFGNGKIYKNVCCLKDECVQKAVKWQTKCEQVLNQHKKGIDDIHEEQLSMDHE